MLYSLLLFPVALLVSQWIGKQLEQLTEEAQANMGRMNVNLQDTLGGMPIVKSYLLSGMLSRSYQVLLQLTAQKKLAVKKREAWVNPLLSTLMISPIIFAVSYGSYLIYNGQLGAGELIAFLYLLNLCLEPLEHIPEPHHAHVRNDRCPEKGLRNRRAADRNRKWPFASKSECRPHPVSERNLRV